jgi:hypothetical protein
MKEVRHRISFVSLTASLLAFCSTGLAQTSPVPGDARSAGLYYIVPDVACWFDTAGGGFITNGFINLADEPNPVDLGTWEPFTSSMGESAFLIEFNTYANDGTYLNQNNVVAIQPAAGGPANLSYAYYDDTGKPFEGQINLSRQNGNPGRVAGDKRIGATNFITECEVSIGQLSQFQAANRGETWANNNIYQGTDRYAAEQIFGLNTNTLVATPVTNAWDYVYGPHVGNMGANNNAPQCSRTGGRPDFLDNGNIVVMIDDKTSIVNSGGEVTTFSIIKPDGTVVKGPTLVSPNAIFDNQCAFQGGFCIRVQTSIFFYDDDGNLIKSNSLAQPIANLQAAAPAGWGFTGAYSEDRGDAQHVAADIRSPYVFMAGGVTMSGGTGTGGTASQSNAVMMAIWNGQTGDFITNVMVSSDLNAGALTVDRTALAVNMSNQVCVVFDGQPDTTLGYANQVIGRVMQFNGANVTYLTPSFFAFVNSDNTNTVASNGFPLGFLTQNASVSMTTKAICIAAKGSINSTNNPYSPTAADSTLGMTSSDYTTVYTVLSMPLGGPETAGSSYIVPDMALWWNSSKNAATNGPVNLAQVGVVSSSDSWEPYTSLMGNSTFLIEFSTYANDGTLANMNNVIAKQPVAGGAPALDYAYYGDATGSSPGPFEGAINLSRQTGNPGRVAGDMRTGATNFITECEVSIGQLPAFMSANRGETWANNNIYKGTDRYAAEQIFSLNPATLAQTPVTNAWDYVYGPYVGSMGANNNSPQCSRTGGRPVFLDNGNIAVVIDDKTSIVSAGGEVTTLAVIEPNGTVVSGPTLVDPRDIWDNVCAFKGGFAVRVHNLMYLYDDDGNALTNFDVNVTSGLVFANDPANAGGRGDAYRIGGNIDSYYVYMAGGTTNVPGYSTAPMSIGLQGEDRDGVVCVAVWDTRTAACVATAPVCELDPAYSATSRTMIAVDGSDDFTVAYKLRPTARFPEFQTLARVGKLVGGTNITWLGPSFYPFVNHDAYGGQTFGGTNSFETDEPSVAMTTQQICISAKGRFNSTNNPAAAPDTSEYSDLYTVIANPAAATAVTPASMTATLSAGSVVISWNATAGLLTLVSSSNPAAPLSSWTAVSPQPATTGPVNGKYSMTVPVTAGNQYFDLKR